jgi:hypothetical protein
VAWFHLLNKSVKTDVILKATDLRRKDLSAEKERSENTTQKTRRELDCRNSVSAPSFTVFSMAEEDDGYGMLATIFNDYDEFRPQNLLIQYHQPEGHLFPLPITPMIAY